MLEIAVNTRETTLFLIASGLACFVATCITDFVYGDDCPMHWVWKIPEGVMMLAAFGLLLVTGW